MTDGASDAQGDEHDSSTIPCWDCSEDVSLRAASRHEVMDHDATDGMGYETYEAYLCPACARKRQPRHPCGTCGREYPDLEAAATCCTGGMRGPI